ncbi:hypothetical protein [Geodermatophilus sp. SYSU D00766]
MGTSGRFVRLPWRAEPHTTPAEERSNGSSAPERALSARENALREDLGKEYYAILGVITEYDKQLVIVKGWSVTLSLAGLGLGFQQEHYALFALAAASALAFWYVDARMKGFQLHYYWRMRDIEVAACQINAVPLDGLGLQSAPRIDLSWGYDGKRPEPVLERRSAKNVRDLLGRPWRMGQVLLPHAAAVVIGAGLFVAALLDAPGLADLQP